MDGYGFSDMRVNSNWLGCCATQQPCDCMSTPHSRNITMIDREAPPCDVRAVVQNRQVWRDAARRRIVAVLGDHFKWSAIVDELAAFFFTPDRPPLRLSDMQRIAEELSDRFAGEIRPVSCTVEDVRVVLNLLEELADCRFIRLDPDTGGPVGEVSAVEVGAILGQWRHPGPDGERAREATHWITIDWRAVAPKPAEPLAPSAATDVEAITPGVPVSSSSIVRASPKKQRKPC